MIATKTNRRTKKPDGDMKKGWSGFQRNPDQCHTTKKVDESDLKDVIILDTGSTIEAALMNPKLISDIKVTSKPFTMVTNAREKKMFFKGKINGFGEAWYDPDQVANIFGFSKLEDQCRIPYDSTLEKAFHVHTNDGIVKFKRNVDGQYVYQRFKEYLSVVANENQVTGSVNATNLMVRTMNENKIGYSKREFEDAKVARKLHHILGCPTVENFKAILRQNIIKNCPVTIEDVVTAENIFGPDIGSLKGKSTRSKPIPH
jgi:hypothetical protein